MTIRERLETLLVEHGLWPNEAQAVVILSEVQPGFENMEGRWDEELAGYPPQMLPVLWLSVKQQAIEWIDRNKPRHFARMALTDG